MLVDKVLAAQTANRKDYVLRQDPFVTQLEDEIVQYAADNPFSDTFVVKLTPFDSFAINRERLKEYFIKQGFDAFYTEVDRQLIFVIKWQIL